MGKNKNRRKTLAISSADDRLGFTAARGLPAYCWSLRQAGKSSARSNKPWRKEHFEPIGADRRHSRID